MDWKPADFERIAALDAVFAFLEEPETTFPIDRATAPGPLIGVKSNIAVARQSWTAGIGARRDEIAQRDARVVAKLRAAGAGLLSRLNMDEAALGATGRNPSFRRTRNPAVPGRSPGGSSAGSAVAVATGACDIALGTDTLGSVRIPAAYCGVYGLKMGKDALSMEGVFPLARSLDALGFLAKDCDAISAALDVFDFPAAQSRGKVSFLTVDEAGYDPGLHRALRAAERAIVEQGITVTTVKPPVGLPSLRSDAFILTEVEASQALSGQDGLSDDLQRMLDYGARLSAERRAGIETRLATAAQAFSDLVQDGTVLVLPTVGAPPVRETEAAPQGQADFTAFANVAGLPALAVPMIVGGRPFSLQLVGQKGSERVLLDMGQMITMPRES